jgi:hypothetical protein
MRSRPNGTVLPVPDPEDDRSRRGPSHHDYLFLLGFGEAVKKKKIPCLYFFKVDEALPDVYYEAGLQIQIDTQDRDFSNYDSHAITLTYLLSPSLFLSF